MQVRELVPVGDCRERCRVEKSETTSCLNFILWRDAPKRRHSYNRYNEETLHRKSQGIKQGRVRSV